jgi:DNA-binding transcriptional MerR regulator
MPIMLLPEVSEKTRVPEATLRYWRHLGKGPKSFRNGKRVMYLEADVDAWLEEQRSVGASGGGAA